MERGTNTKPAKGFPNVKLFVSHRIDLDAELICDEVYVPVDCGAVYRREPNRDERVRRDDTGEHISGKRMSYCELTVQYWAWKNVRADYYGLSHYRRYLNFAPERHAADAYGNVLDTQITEYTIGKYGLTGENVQRTVQNYDIVLPEEQDVSKYPGAFTSVWDQYARAEHLQGKDLQVVLDIIEQRHPAYLQAAKDYLSGTMAYACNLFVMKAALFDEYCGWLFDILGEFEKRVDMTHYTTEGFRTPGHLGERLLGIFVKYQKSIHPDLRVKHLQPVSFLAPERKKELIHMQGKEEGNRGAIAPAFARDCIPIVLSCSNAYAPYAAALIRSIADHASMGKNYDILLVHSKMAPDNQKRLTSMSLPNHVSLRLIDVTQYDISRSITATGYFSVETYFRLFVPYLLASYSKVLWLDSDTIVRRDVAEMFEADIGDALVAATRDYNAVAMINGMDPDYRKLCVEQLGMEDPYQYFQAGVLLMDLQAFRQTYTFEDMAAEAQNCKYPYADQDILNKLCYGRVYWLDNRWDVVADVQDCLSNVLRYWAPHNVYENYMSIRDDPYIVHYAGPTKPWHSPRNAHADSFWNACRRTGFYEIALIQMLSDMSQGIERYGMEPKPKAVGEPEITLPPAQPAGSEAKGGAVKRAVRCLRENGLRYTWMRFVTKLKSIFKGNG